MSEECNDDSSGNYLIKIVVEKVLKKSVSKKVKKKKLETVPDNKKPMMKFVRPNKGKPLIQHYNQSKQ